MESVKTNDEELTSTMGNLLSTSKDDKNDASDSTPTSSTDAFTTTSTSQIAADDPISSTSSDVLDPKKSTEKVNDVAQSSTSVMSSSPVMSTLKEISMGGHSCSIVSAKDLLDMNITDTSTEKITENVDDIVQDLENLLGEPTTSFDFTIRSKDGNRNSSSLNEKDISMDIDAFSAELQMLSEQTTGPKEIIKETLKVGDAAVQQNNFTEPLKTALNATLDTTKKCNKEPTPILEEKESSPLASQSNELSTNTDDIKTDTIEKINEQIENCQFEIISASSAKTEVISVEKSDFSEAQHITSTQSKNEEECAPVTEETKELNEQNTVESNDSEITENEVVKSPEILTSSDEVTAVLEKCAESEKPTVSEEVTSEEKVDEIEEKTLSGTGTLTSSDTSQTVLEKQSVSDDATSEERVNEVEEKHVECQKPTVSDEVTSEQKMDDIEKDKLQSSPRESTSENATEALSSQFEPEQQEPTPKEGEQMEVEVSASKINVMDNAPDSSHLVVESIKQDNDVQDSETIGQHDYQNMAEEETKVESAMEITNFESELVKDDSTVAKEVTETQELAEDVEEPTATCAVVEEVNEAKTEEEPLPVSDANVKNDVEETSEVEGVEETPTSAVVEDVDEAKTEELETVAEAAVERDVEINESKEIDSTVEEASTSKTIQEEEEKMEVDAALDEDNHGKAVNIEQNDVTKIEEIVTVVAADEVSRDEEMEVATTSTADDEPTNSAAIIDENKLESKIEIDASESIDPVEEQTEDSTKTAENIQGDICIEEDKPVEEKTEDFTKTGENIEGDTCIEEDKLVEEKCDSKIEIPEIFPEIANQTQAVLIEEKCDSRIEVPEILPEVTDQTQLVSAEEKCDNEKEILPEIAEQTQPVSSSSEEEVKTEDKLDTGYVEALISGKIEQPVESEIVDQDTEEVKAPSDSKEVLTVGENEAIEASTEEQSQPKTELEDVMAVDQTVAPDSAEIQEEDVPEQLSTSGIIELQPLEASEESQPSLVEIPILEPPNEALSAIAADFEDVTTGAPIEFIPDSMEVSARSLADDLDLLVQSAVNDDAPMEAAMAFEDKSASELQVPTSSDDNLKSLEGVIENNILPLAMDDVPDLDVLNAISNLSDNKSSIMTEMDQNIQQSDALLTSSSLEPTSSGDAPFEANIETSLPSVDEIFAEPNQQQPVELQDDNLETLLAVASLQNVDYSIPPVEDFTPTIEPVSDFVPEEPVLPIDEVPSFAAEESGTPVGEVQDFILDKSSPILDEVPNLVPEESVPPVEYVSTFVPEEAALPESSCGPQESCFPIEDDAHLGPDEPKVVPVEKRPKVEVLPETKDRPTGESKPEKSKSSRKDEHAQEKLKEPLVINIEENDKERVYSPKITIKPIKPPDDEETVSSASGENECSKGSLKMTITKQSDNTHSILKIYDPDDDNAHTEADHHQSEPSVPKLIIKPIIQPNEQPQSPKMSTRSSKQVFSPSSSQRSSSPRITIKPIPKPEESVAPLKITIKPVLKTDDSHKQKHSPKLTIKPILKPEDECVETKVHSPRVTIKPIVKPPEEMEQVSSPRITIKPIVKPVETVSETSPTTPRVTIKPVVKPTEKERNSDVEPVERSSPKITIKPIVKPHETEPISMEDFEDSIKERIVLKINKGTIPSGSKELRRREIPQEEEKSEKLTKIKLKFSREGGHPHIVQEQSPTKRSAEHSDHDRNKRQRLETEHFLPGVTITPIAPTTHSKLKEMLSRHDHLSSDKVVTIDDDDDDVTIVEEQSKPSPIVISEESNQDSMNSATIDLRDPISEIPVFEITPDSVKTINPQVVASVADVPAPPAPRKRGRPRKVPLQVREDFKDPKEEEPKPIVVESTRPKRSCRGQSVRTTLGIKPRKPRGPGRGRGSKRGMGTRSTPTPPEAPPKPAKEPKLGGTKLKELKEDSFLLSDKSEVKTIEIDDGLQKSPSNSLAPPQSDSSTSDRADIVMYEEETRMSADTSSRAQTPAKQVVTTIPTVDLVEESQSSVQSIQSTATSESVKVRRGPRLEVHQEPEGAVISADQLAEYYWSGGGPYMLQEQVAQFLGIKSFKRKYPNISRRVVDMQERDFIRESGLAGEAMCDLGLTAVNSSDILDIMYSDFQDKYEEYCKHQRDRQAKDLINKQKALSLAASQEKAKMDITQQAVQSAASWNASFNKARRDQRKSCMDLQTLTIHFPKGRMKQISKPKIGYYPVALVPGQFTDYYREFTPTEVNNLPLNTMCYDPIIRNIHQEMDCDSQTDGSGSDSDSSSSDSDSSYSGSSDAEDCTLCKHTPKRVAAAQ